MNLWQPIETAPIKPFNEKDWYMPHSEYLLLFSSHAVIGYYGYTRTGKGRWRSGGSTCFPTHWQPLPPPPDTKEGV